MSMVDVTEKPIIKRQAEAVGKDHPFTGNGD